MADWTGTLVIGLIIMGLIVMARSCGLSGRRGWKADDSAPLPPDTTRGFRDPFR